MNRFNSNPNPDSLDSSDSRTIVFIFAGRKKFLQILMRYLNRELAAGVIDEVHLWNCCFKGSDAKYIRSLATPKIKIMGDGWFDQILNLLFIRRRKRFMHKYRSVYRYYASPKAGIKDSDVLIKMDDDILYLKNLGVLCDYVRTSSEPGFVYPNIINNDVAAVWQAHDGQLNKDLLPPSIGNILSPDCLHDMELPALEYAFSKWYYSANCARSVFDQFLANPSAFVGDQIHDWRPSIRLSINCFAARGDYAKIAFASIKGHDEVYISHKASLLFDTATRMIMQCVVVHFSFSPQLVDGTLEPYVEKFAALADTELAKD